MRAIAVVGTIGGITMRAYLASVTGYAGWFAYQLLQGSLWRWFLLISVPFWALAMAVASLPAALAGSLAAQLALRAGGRVRWPALLAGLGIAAFAGTCLFTWYMSALLGLIDWRSRWPWPLAVSTCAYLLECGWLSRRPASR
jgi:hypothetical protein